MLALCGAALLAAVGGPAYAAEAQSDGLVCVQQAQVKAGTRVVDVRDEGVCTRASLAGARCLPAADLFDAEGRPADFFALRWLFGTIGLSGDEEVLVVAQDPRDAAAVGALLFLAGERRVAVLERPLTLAAGAPGGSARNLTREAVFTAPMRDRLLLAAAEAAAGTVIAGGRPIDRLRALACRAADAGEVVQLSLAP